MLRGFGVANDERFPYALAHAMEEQGLTGYRLAKLTGIPQPAVSRLLNGKRKPTADIIMRLAKVFAPGTIDSFQQARALDMLDAEGIYLDGTTVMDSFIPLTQDRPVSVVSSAPGAITRLPVYSDISCGWGGAVDERPEYYDFPTILVGGADHAVTAMGDSMKDLGFLPGTYLFIKSQPTADNGQPVIARLDGETFTCKVYRDSGRRRWLEGRSDTFKDRIYLDAHDVEILGVVVAFWGKP